MPPIGPTVTIPFVDERVEDGAFRPGEMHESAAEQTLDELARTAVVVRRLRTATVMRRLRGATVTPAGGQMLDALARTAVVVRRLRTATVMRRLRGERTDPALRTRRRPECLSPGAFPVC
jgi:hypothetical protein